MDILIPRNSTIPIIKTQLYSTNVDDQDAVDIEVYEGERKNVKDNHKLAQFTLDGIPKMPKGMPQIQVVFDIDTNGILTVSASEISSKVEAHITVSTDRRDYSKEDIDAMLKEAENFRELDQKAAERIELKNYLDNYLYRISKEMKSQNAGELLSEDEIKGVNTMVVDVVEWLEEHNDAKYDELKSKELEVMIIAEPILSKLYILPTRETPWIETTDHLFVDDVED